MRHSFCVSVLTFGIVNVLFSLLGRVPCSCLYTFLQTWFSFYWDSMFMGCILSLSSIEVSFDSCYESITVSCFWCIWFTLIIRWFYICLSYVSHYNVPRVRTQTEAGVWIFASLQLENTVLNLKLPLGACVLYLHTLK